MVDNGSGGLLTDTDAGTIANKPYLRSHQLVYPNTETGKFFRMRIIALNEISSVQSTLTSVILAGVPDQPATSPVKDSALSNESQIRVTFVAPVSDGGSSIRSYELQMDDGKGGDFVSLVGDT